MTSGAGHQGTLGSTDALQHRRVRSTTPVGANALLSNVDGFSNNAFGNAALFFNVHASENTALGDFALAFNDSSGLGLGNNNTAVGAAALFNNVDGSENTAVGTGAGQNVIAGFNNTYIGDFVGYPPAPSPTKAIRSASATSQRTGSGPQPASSVVSSTTSSLLAARVVEVTLDLDDRQAWLGFWPEPGVRPERRTCASWRTCAS